MIAIINLGRNILPTGIHEYVVMINREEICRFKHTREEGLGQCLRRAAMAVDKVMTEKPTTLIIKEKVI